jgi:site-specific DNA-methyltransferase (adenine-specific)
VDLVYLDPPFNSQRGYNMIFKEHGGVAPTAQLEAFGDTWTWDERARDTLKELRESPRTPEKLRALLDGLDGAIHASEMMAYVSMMAIRLVELHRVLKPTGSLYLHCDPTASHYLKIVLDGIFGPENFRNETVWRRSRAHNDRTIRRYGAIHDVLLFYSKSDVWTFNPQFTERDRNAPKTHDIYVHTDGKTYRKGDCRAPGNRGPRYTWNGHTFHWRFSPEERDRLIADGKIVYSASGMPRVLRPMDPDKGSPLQDVWTDIDALNSGSREILGYPTQKPVALLERIIKASSNEGEVVLDPFCGCGTALDAAERLHRRWIGIDVTHLAIGVIEQRLQIRHPGVLYDVRGLPQDVASAQKLADEDKFGFQAWAVLKIAGRPMGLDFAGRAKKGADQGRDGILTFSHDPDGREVERLIISVKGGGTGAGDVRELIGVVETPTNKAVMGVLITVSEPTKPMRDAALDKGMWYSKTWGKEYPRVQLLSVSDLFKGKRPEYPGRNVTFAIAETADRDEEQIVIPGMGVEGLSPEMAKRKLRNKPKRVPKTETAEIAFADKKESASRTARAARLKRAIGRR